MPGKEHGAGARANRGWDGYGRRERKGRETVKDSSAARVPKAAEEDMGVGARENRGRERTRDGKGKGGKREF